MSVRHRLAAAAAAALTLTAGAAATAPADAATTAATCRVAWGSVDKMANAVPERAGAALGTPRTGHHACYDRVVFDVKGTVGSVGAGYVADGQGAVLVVATRHDTLNPPMPSDTLYRTGLRTVPAYGGAVWTQQAQGFPVITRARLPFRLFLLKGPGTRNRVVVDVAHRW